MATSLGATRCSRRQLLAACGASAAGAAALVLDPGLARADAADFRARIGAIAGGRPIREGRVVLDIPEVSENGGSVPVTISVLGPMPPGHFVKALHLLAEDNPEPEVATYYFTARSGQAVVSARIRLAQAQKVWAIAELSDGSLFSAAREVQVTVNGCGG